MHLVSVKVNFPHFAIKDRVALFPFHSRVCVIGVGGGAVYLLKSASESP